jgi:hypothetical protein
MNIQEEGTKIILNNIHHRSINNIFMRTCSSQEMFRLTVYTKHLGLCKHSEHQTIMTKHIKRRLAS